MTKTKNFLLSVFIIFLIFYILFMPSSACEAAENGLRSCASLIPYLFPYIVVGAMISKSVLGDLIAKFFSPLMPWFNLPSSLAPSLALGLISGFPVSAVSASKVYIDGNCTNEEASRLICFASNPSPSFVIALSGGAVLGNIKAGLILYAFQLIAFFVSGIILGIGKKSKNTSDAAQKNKYSLSHALTESVSSATSSIIIICGFIIFFSFISGFISEFFSDSLVFTKTLTKGFLEIGTGVYSCYDLSYALRLPALCFILGFGGVSALFQILGVTREIKLSLPSYFTAKLINIFFLLIGAYITARFIV